MEIERCAKLSGTENHISPNKRMNFYGAKCFAFYFERIIITAALKEKYEEGC